MLKIFRRGQHIPAKIENEATFCIPEHIIAHRNDDGLVLLDSSTGLVFTANRTAAAVWDAITQGRTVETMAAQLNAGTDLSCGRTLEDTRTYLHELQRRGLVSAGTRS